MSELQQKFAMSKYASSGDRNKAMLEHIESLTAANEALREENERLHKALIKSNEAHQTFAKNRNEEREQSSRTVEADMSDEESFKYLKSILENRS
jgi:regulator of replication initiation timing